MKSYNIILFFTFLAFKDAVQAQSELERDLATLFNKWLKGDPNFPFPLPALHAITLPSFDGVYESIGVKMSYWTSDMVVEGLSEAYLEDLKANMTDTTLSLRGVITAPKLTGAADRYTLDGTAYIFMSIKGDGQIRVNLENGVVTFDVELRINGPSLMIEKLDLDLNIDKVTLELTGTTDFVIKQMNSNINSYFESNRKIIGDSLSEAAIPWLNSFLQQVPPKELLDVITNLRQTAALRSYLLRKVQTMDELIY